MAIIATFSNHYFEQKLNGAVDVKTDTIKAILMSDTFTFDKDTHNTLADVTASQLASGYGYTQDNKTLSGATVTRDDVNDKATITFDSVTWNAVGGDIGPFSSIILYSDTSLDDTIIVCYALNDVFTIPSGDAWEAENLKIENKQGS